MCKTEQVTSLGPRIQVVLFLDLFRNGMYGTVLTDKGSYVVGKQQLVFDVKYFRSRIVGRLIRIFLRYIGLWVEHLDLLSSQIL